MLRLGDIKPRERAGALTAQRYEFQYQRTARAALTLLDDATQHVCVYCDWHDDFVIEVGEPPTRYVFHQVKGRTSSKGPWTFHEFFGVQHKKGAKPAVKPPAVSDNAIFPLMLLHHHNFAASCAGLAFVTNAGFDPTLSGFINDIAATPEIKGLAQATRIAFDHLAGAYATANAPLASSPTDLFAWLRSLTLYPDQGKLDDENAALLELGDTVEQFSEIDLLQSESKQIARQIIARVRTKASHSTTTIPAPDGQLRKDKGIVVGELLSVLSLSTEGYEALKSGESGQTVRTLSRLQRYCRKDPQLDEHVVEICGFKAAWDIWRTTERHFMKTADYVVLANKTKDIIQAGYKLDRMIDEAKAVATHFAGLTGTPLAGEHVLGLMFSLAAQTDRPSAPTPNIAL
jgi:hypothetical protein